MAGDAVETPCVTAMVTDLLISDMPAITAKSGSVLLAG
jgi:hypothetical protein